MSGSMTPCAVAGRPLRPASVKRSETGPDRTAKPVIQLWTVWRETPSRTAVKFQQRYVKSHRIGRAEGLASDPHGLNRVLVSLVDRFQRQMLVDVQALFAFVPGNQLNLCVGEALGRKVSQHLMAEQVRVNRLRQAGLLAVALHDLLDSARGERPEPPSLK